MVDFEMNAEEFAEFWEGHEEERELGIKWIAKQLPTDEGKELVSKAAQILAKRWGNSSDKIKSFRAAMRKASETAGLDPLTIGLEKDETSGDKMFVVRPARRQKSPKVADPVQLVYNRMKKWVVKGECTIEELSEAVSDLMADLS